MDGGGEWAGGGTRGEGKGIGNKSDSDDEWAGRGTKGGGEGIGNELNGSGEWAGGGMKGGGEGIGDESDGTDGEWAGKGTRDEGKGIDDKSDGDGEWTDRATRSEGEGIMDGRVNWWSSEEGGGSNMETVSEPRCVPMRGPRSTSMRCGRGSSPPGSLNHWDGGEAATGQRSPGGRSRGGQGTSGWIGMVIELEVGGLDSLAGGWCLSAGACPCLCSLSPMLCPKPGAPASTTLATSRMVM